MGKAVRGKPAVAFPDALLPVLLAFVVTNGSLKLEQVCGGVLPTAT